MLPTENLRDRWTSCYTTPSECYSTRRACCDSKLPKTGYPFFFPLTQKSSDPADLIRKKTFSRVQIATRNRRNPQASRSPPQGIHNSPLKPCIHRLRAPHPKHLGHPLPHPLCKTVKKRYTARNPARNPRPPLNPRPPKISYPKNRPKLPPHSRGRFSQKKTLEGEVRRNHQTVYKDRIFDQKRQVRGKSFRI